MSRNSYRASHSAIEHPPTRRRSLVHVCAVRISGEDGQADRRAARDRRGIVNPVAAAAIDRAGVLQAVIPPAGKEVGQIIRRADERRRRQQKRRGITSHRHAEAVDHQLHLLANAIGLNAAR